MKNRTIGDKAFKDTLTCKVIKLAYKLKLISSSTYCDLRDNAFERFMRR